ncbi:hypothetical protein [uncultured Shewanella sp.]|uniref:hypothetical protein n=1 Tax=uncultured Shewanella sp. TaxID=173975 RepID=UPI002627D340|nr:hypothetical protein [uncultured Shewanella sp.]
MSALAVPLPVMKLSVAIVIVCKVNSTFLNSRAVAELGADRVAIIGTLGPVITTSLAVSILNEAYTIYYGLGTLFGYFRGGIVRQE